MAKESAYELNLSSKEEQSLRLTGRLTEIALAEAASIKKLNQNKSFLGTGIYAPDRQHGGELAVIHFSNNDSQITEDHKRFTSEVLGLRRVFADETSVGEALRKQKTGIYKSQMADHQCLNIVEFTDEGPFVYQLVFDKDADIDLGNPKSVIHQQTKYGSIADTVTKLSQEFGNNFSKHLALEPPVSPNGALLYADITGSSDIISAHGRHNAFQFTKTFRDALQRDLKAVIVRPEGDGIMFGFSKIDQNILHAAKQVLQRYAKMREGRKSYKAIAESKIKVAIATGYFEHFIKEGSPVFEPVIENDSLAYNIIREMINAAPREDDEILLSMEAAKILGFDETLDLKKIAANSTFTDHMYAWEDFDH